MAIGWLKEALGADVAAPRVIIKTMTARMLLFSDLHLDAVTMGVPRFEELLGTLAQVKEIARVNECSSYVFLGDLCNPDSPTAFRCVAAMAEWGREMRKDLGAEGYFVDGNHDVVEDGHGTSVLSPLASVDGAEVVHSPSEYVQDGVNLAFLPYPSRAKSYDPTKWAKVFEKNTGLVFGHLNLKDAVPAKREGGDEVDEYGAIVGTESEEMARGREVMWPVKNLRARCPGAKLFGGHYHGGVTFGGVHIVGSPALFTFGEQANRPRVGVIDLPSCEHRWVELQYRLFRTISFGDLTAPVKDAFVRVKSQTMLTDGQIAEFDRTLQRSGVLASKLVIDVGEHAAPKARPVLQLTAADGDALALQMADEWATPDPALKAAVRTTVEACIKECA